MAKGKEANRAVVHYLTYPASLRLCGEYSYRRGGETQRIMSEPYRSIIAVMPCPPAAQMEIRPRPEPRSTSSLASVPMILPPVAAKGWPAARLLPLTLSLVRSIVPSGLTPNSLVLSSALSQILSTVNTCAANASCIS